MENIELDLLPAWGNKTLVKVRLKPKDIGVLLSKMKPDELTETLKSMMSEVKLYKPEIEVYKFMHTVNKGVSEDVGH